MKMRSVYVLAAASAAVGFMIATAPAVQAAPVAGIAAPDVSTGLVEKTAMYRRHYRHRAVPAEPMDGRVVGEARPPAMMVIRPTSCGQFKYWDGMACVDARYTDPYLGPKG